MYLEAPPITYEAILLTHLQTILLVKTRIQFTDLQISSTCFGQYFAHRQEHKTAINHSLALLMMGRLLPKTG